MREFPFGSRTRTACVLVLTQHENAVKLRVSIRQKREFLASRAGFRVILKRYDPMDGGPAFGGFRDNLLKYENMMFHDSLSLIFLASLPFMVFFQIWMAFRQPTNYSVLERILYAPVYCLGRVLWRVEIVGCQKISELHRGGAILVANHRCSLDPFFLQLAAGRRVHWMVAGEYFKNPLFGPVLNIFQAIPTNRTGADTASMKRAIRLASEGRLVGMFPEGRINRTTKPLLNIRSGAAMVASKSGVPILPCWIDGAPSGWAVWSGLFMSAHVRVFIGQAVKTNPDDGISLSPDELIEGSMRQALDLGGHPDSKVELARNRVHSSNK